MQQQHASTRFAAGTTAALAFAAAAATGAPLLWPAGTMLFAASARAAQPQPSDIAEGQRIVVQQRGKYYYATVERLFREHGATMLRYRWTAGHAQGNGTLPLAPALGHSVFTLEQAHTRGFEIANPLPDETAASPASRNAPPEAAAPPAAAAATAAGPVSDGLSAAEQSEMVVAHNRWRHQVGVPPVAWSDRLAKGAQDWAEHIRQTRNCTIDESAHTDRNDVGENLAWRSPVRYTNGRVEFQQATPADITDSWGSEKQGYDYANNSCSGVCGHYTQIVWKSTREIGCGHAVCASNKSQVWVCRYAPPGNYIGQKPY